MKRDQDDMSARNPETSEQADDVATLYSWANLHGAKYRDFSGSRQQMRAQMRQRTLAEQAQLAREEAQRARPPMMGESPGWEDLLAGGPPPGVVTQVRHELPAERRFEPPAAPEPPPAPMPPPRDPGGGMRYGFPEPPVLREEAAAGEARLPGIRSAEPEAERPAWLAERNPGAATVSAAAPVPAPPQSAAPAWIPEPAQPVRERERVASRWYGLRGVLGRGPEEAQEEPYEGHLPVLAVFSLAGGVGKTSLVAALGRALAARDERVLLADTCTFGVLPFYFGAREIKPGVVRTFSGGTGDPPIRVLTLEMERGSADPDFLRKEIVRGMQDVGRVLIDVATGSAATLRQVLRLSPTVLVPMVPDMTSVVTLQTLEGFFRSQEGYGGRPLPVWYVLSQFDASSRLHQDVREVLRQQLGERLLPVAVHRSAVMSEALADGMTVIDYAPNSPPAEDVMNLATWIRNTSVAADGGHRAARWSER